MAAADARANSPADSFDFNQSPRAFVPIKAPYPAKFFIGHMFGSDYFIPDYE
jgi:hypothetical protein